ncbi:MAG: peptidoglycan-binding protein, partial [Microcoleus sp. SIO2G3]|nr:peptidoglycan-binding protein [Microcoleus sp. SIO2G3]
MPCRLALLLLVCTASLSAGQPVSAATPSGQTIASPSIALHVGSRGASVTTLQSHLQKLGFYSGAIDGQYGSSTKLAVEAFQRSAGLPADGQVGSNTWQHLLAVAAPTPIELAASPAPSPPSAAALPARWVAVGLAVLLASIGAAGALHLLKTKRKQQKLLAVPAAIGSEITSIEPILEPNAVTAEPHAHTNRSIDRSIESQATVQETTRLPKFDLA